MIQGTSTRIASIARITSSRMRTCHTSMKTVQNARSRNSVPNRNRGKNIPWINPNPSRIRRMKGIWGEVLGGFFDADGINSNTSRLQGAPIYYPLSLALSRRERGCTICGSRTVTRRFI
jgi:hypothetical protein